jgi:hypothetical protein
MWLALRWKWSYSTIESRQVIWPRWSSPASDPEVMAVTASLTLGIEQPPESAGVEHPRTDVVVCVEVLDGQHDKVMVAGARLVTDAHIQPAGRTVQQYRIVAGDAPGQVGESVRALGRYLSSDRLLLGRENAHAQPPCTAEQRPGGRCVMHTDRRKGAGPGRRM